MKPEASTLKVFVYGTLKPGEANYSHYCNGYVESQTIAYTKGILYALPIGYPAMVEGNNKVRGILLTCKNSDILASLDRLEGYQPQRKSGLNEYYRLLVSVYSLEDQLIDLAWAYFMTPEKIREYKGILVESNWWTSF
ncbi:gamma-glutamylcyclotransferase [Waterburya agarophytonicola K14]|uniref:Gamma-glutamylcyclotransferase n=2 Tax=Waterburya TaxID=2886915 RepID=A0A964BPW8_9CYAN|nr:gamma-glutamylcyclotransferase [Waterburya agarophytonicola KI4]